MRKLEWAKFIPKEICVLGGGPGLGFYVPALVLQKQLTKCGYCTYFHVYESLLSCDKIERLNSTIASFHRNFKAALIAQKIARTINESLDKNKLELLFDEWAKKSCLFFVCFSGHWIPILEMYRSYKRCVDFTVVLCHIDSVNSVSWSLYNTSQSFFNPIWFNDWESRRINYYLNIDRSGVVPFRDRATRFVIHGGGWGIGTYAEEVKLLENLDVDLDILLYGLDDTVRFPSTRGGDAFYLLDPTWKYWMQYENGHSFPPIAKYGRGEDFNFQNNDDYPKLYNVLKNCKAIVSKPGAGTLLDSISSATPIIILKPFGEYEERNGDLWRDLGFGIWLEDWKNTRCKMDILEELHYNIEQCRAKTPDFLSIFYESKN